MVCDFYKEKWRDRLQPIYVPMPNTYPWPNTNLPPHVPLSPVPLTQDEINDFRELLKRAKSYDEKTGQKECGLEEKKQRLKELAKELGAEIKFE